jgi:hypothetical protein
MRPCLKGRTFARYAGLAAGAGRGAHETPLERLDRNLEELTGELRVVVTGVQVLFAFLLIVPFNAGFARRSPRADPYRALWPSGRLASAALTCAMDEKRA